MDSLAVNAFYSVLKSCSSLVFPLVTYSYAARTLFPDGMGKIEFSRSYIAYFVFLAMLGVVNYGTREGAKVREDREALSRLARELLLINTASALLSCAVLAATLLFVPRLEDYRQLLLIFSLNVPLAAAGMEWLYNAVEDYRYSALRTALAQAVSLVLMLLFVRERSDLPAYALIQVFASVGGNVFNLIHAKKYIDLLPRRKEKPVAPLRHLRPVVLLFAMSVFIEIFTHMDSTMLGLMAGDYSVGLYAAALKMTGIAASIILALGQVAMPRISYYAGKRAFDEIWRLCGRTVHIIFMLGVPAAIGMAMLSESLLWIFCGADYLAADTVAKVLSARILLVPLNSFLVLCLFIPLGKEKKNLLSTGAAAALNLVLNAWLIPRIGHLGAGISTVLAESIELVFNVFFLSKAADVRSIFLPVWQYFCAGAPIVFLCRMIQAAGFPVVMSVALCMAASSAAYFLALLLLRNEYAVKWASLIISKRSKS